MTKPLTDEEMGISPVKGLSDAEMGTGVPSQNQPSVFRRVKNYVKQRSEADLKFALGLPLSEEDRRVLPFATQWEKLRSHGPGPSHPASLIAGRAMQLNPIAGSSTINEKVLESNPEVQKAAVELERRARQEWGDKAGPLVAGGLQFAPQAVGGMALGALSAGTAVASAIPSTASAVMRVGAPVLAGTLESIGQGVAGEAIGAEPGQERAAAREFLTGPGFGVAALTGVGGGLMGPAVAKMLPKDPPVVRAGMPAWLRAELDAPPRKFGHAPQYEKTQELMPPTSAGKTRPALPVTDATAPTSPMMQAAEQGVIPNVMEGKATDPFFQAQTPEGRLAFEPGGRPSPDVFHLTEAEKIAQVEREAGVIGAELKRRRAADIELSHRPGTPVIDRPEFTQGPTPDLLMQSPVVMGKAGAKGDTGGGVVGPVPQPARFNMVRFAEGELRKLKDRSPGSVRVVQETLQKKFGLNVEQAQKVLEQADDPNWQRDINEQRTQLGDYPVSGGGAVDYAQHMLAQQTAPKQKRTPIFQYDFPDGLPKMTELTWTKVGGRWVLVPPKGYIFFKRTDPMTVVGKQRAQGVVHLWELRPAMGGTPERLMLPAGAPPRALPVGLAQPESITPKMIEAGGPAVPAPLDAAGRMQANIDRMRAAAEQMSPPRVIPSVRDTLPGGPPPGEGTQISTRQIAQQVRRFAEAQQAADRLEASTSYILQHANDPEAMKQLSRIVQARRLGPVPEFVKPPAPKDGPVPRMDWNDRALARMETAPNSGTKPGPVVDDPTFPMEGRASPEMTLHAAAAEIYKDVNKARSMRSWLARQLGLAENRADNRGDSEAAYAIRQWAASKGMSDQMFEKVFPQLEAARRAMPAAERARADSVIKDLKDGKNVPLDRLPAGVRDLYKEQFREIDKMRDALLKAGYFTPEEQAKFQSRRDRGVLWLTRDYEIFYRKKAYKNSLPKFESALHEYVKDAAAHGAPLSLRDAAADVKALMYRMYEGHSGGVLAGEFSREGVWKTSQIARDVLKHRTEIPWYFRDLMGEIHNPSFVVAMSHAEMYRMYKQYLLTKQLAAPELKGQVWDSVPSEKMYPEAVGTVGLSMAENRRAFGELAGKYVTPEVFESLMMNSAPRIDNFAIRLMSTAQGWFRTAKVLMSPTTYVRNFTSNWFYSTAAGLPPWHPSFAGYQKQSLSAIRDYIAAPTIEQANATPAGKWMVWATEDGAVRPGRGSDLGGGHAKQIIEDVLGGKEPGDPLYYADRVYRSAAKGKVLAGELYELIDTQSRLANYISNVEKGVKRHGDVRRARRDASAIVNRFYASGSSIGPGVRWLANNAPVAPFLSWHVDNLRVMKNIASSWKTTGDLGPTLRVLAFAGLIEGVSALSKSGLTDQQVAVADASISPNYKKSHPLRSYWTFDTDPKTGVPKYVVSMGAFAPYEVFLKGGDTQSLPNKIATGIVEGVYSGGMLEPWGEDLLNAVGGPKAIEPRAPYPGEETDRAAKQVWDWGVPQLVKQTQDAARRTRQSELRPAEELLSPTEAFFMKVPGIIPAFAPEKLGNRAAYAGARGERFDTVKPVQQVRRINKDRMLTAEQKRRYIEEAFNRSVEAGK